MSKTQTVLAVAIAMTACASAFAAGPCETIKEACTSAGFIPKDYKVGKGLWRDCVDPIMQGKTANGATITLPTVDPSVVSACKAKHPNFGEGKVGS